MLKLRIISSSFNNRISISIISNKGNKYPRSKLRGIHDDLTNVTFDRAVPAAQQRGITINNKKKWMNDSGTWGTIHKNLKQVLEERISPCSIHVT